MNTTKNEKIDQVKNKLNRNYNNAYTAMEICWIIVVAKGKLSWNGLKRLDQKKRKIKVDVFYCFVKCLLLNQKEFLSLLS